MSVLVSNRESFKAALSVLVSLAAVSGAAAQEGVLMRDLLGNLGLINPERPPIEYRERAPLVLPPGATLRAPGDPGAVAAKNPQWPNDPDVAERRRRDAEARIPVTESERRRMSDNNPRVSVDELRAGRRPGAGIPTTPSYRYGDNARDDSWVSPDKLRSEGRKADAASSSGERQTLTDPPTGLLAPAGGGKVARDFEPIVRRDEADPKEYLREQRQRR